MIPASMKNREAKQNKENCMTDPPEGLPTGNHAIAWNSELSLAAMPRETSPVGDKFKCQPAQESKLSNRKIIAAKKILRCLKLCKKLREAYEQRFLELLERNIVKIQKFVRAAQLRRNAKEKGLYRATIELDTSKLGLGPVSKVEVFGEFSKSAPWTEKVLCRKTALGAARGIFCADIDIKLGQKFKFIIDSGRAYAISEHYGQASDEAGIVNNVFRFHERASQPPSAR